MKNLAIRLPDQPGALARMGEALAAAGISVEGGGVFVVGHTAVANFLVVDAVAARRALEEADIAVAAVQEVVMVRLKQDEPGQLGMLARRMADRGVNIEVQYSDHDHRLVLVVDDLDSAQEVAALWANGAGERCRCFDFE
jgi:hypothetical protein